MGRTVKEYSQMIGFLTRDKTSTVPRSMDQEPMTLDQEPRTGFYKGKLVTMGPKKGQYNVAVSEGGGTVQKYFPNEQSMNKFIETKGTQSKIDDPQRLKDITKYFKDFKKENNKFPTLKETTIHFDNILGKDINPSITLAAKEADIELPSGYGKNLKTKVDLDIKKLLNRKNIIDTLESGKFPTESQIQNVLNATRTTASTRQVDLAEYLAGNVDPELKADFKIPTKYKNVATTAISDFGSIKEGQFSPRKSKTKTYNEKRLAKMLGIDSFSKTRSDILKKIQSFIPELKGVLGVDEIGGITAGARTNSPYTIFGQVIGRDFNQNAKATGIDKSKSLLERKLLQLPKDDPQRLIELEKYNQKVDDFEQMANKNNPAKKVKAMKLSFEKPSKAIKNKKVYNQYKDLFDAHHEKYGYSFEVDKDTDSITDILKKLDNKSYQNQIKNNFKSLINKPGPRGGKVAVATALATLAGTGFALADEEGLSTGEKTAIGGGTTAAAGGAYAARKPIMAGLGKAFRTLGTRPAGVGMAGYSIADNLKKGENVVDATLDPIVGLELMLPNLFKENVSKITSNPYIQKALKFGKYGRALTPIGAGITAAGLGIDAYKYGKERKKLLDSLTDEQKTNLFRQEQSDVVKQQLRGDQNAFDEFSAAEGGLADLMKKYYD